MVIECSSCHARFKLADDKIKETGTKVRCTKCREVFTVFPDPPPSLVPPVMAVVPDKPIAPVAAAQKGVAANAFFPETDTPPRAVEASPAVADVPANEEDDWNQDAASALFTDGFPDDAGASDLDAISFDNVETAVFSVANENEGKFEFADDSAFSLADASLETRGTDQPCNVAATAEQPLLGENSSVFTADFTADFATPPPDLPAPVDQNQLNPVTTDGEFSFAEADNLADLSWDEPDANPVAATPSDQIRDSGSTPQDTTFDFSSFSFDDVDSSTRSDDETAEQGDATIELATQTETSPVPDEQPLIAIETETPPAPVVFDRQENTLRPARPTRPRVRPKKKVSSRYAVKIVLLLLLILAATSAFLNRGKILETYKNIVNSFIENQTQVETSGRIGLINLTGSYVHNSREGNLFVIRGEAVNEFKSLRSSVLVRGTIYDDNGAVLQSQSAYCGNPLNDSNLKKLGFIEIREVMNNELGENLLNLDIAAGKGIPCTIVFNKAPKDIKEFTVEVLESKPGSTK